MPLTDRQRKDARLRRLYKISLDDYEALYRAQGGVCAICRQPEKLRNPRTGEFQDLSVDHCHATNQVRGLLCNECNVAIGKLQDDVTRIRRVIAYLEGTL